MHEAQASRRDIYDARYCAARAARGVIADPLPRVYLFIAATGSRALTSRAEGRCNSYTTLETTFPVAW